MSKRTENGSIITQYQYYDGAEGSSHASYRTGELKQVDYPGASYDVVFSYDRLGRISTVAEDATGGTRSFVYRDGSDLQLDYEELPGFFDNGTTRRLSRTYATSGTVGRYTGFAFGPSGSPLHDTAYAYSASTGRLDTVSRSGHTTVSYGFVAIVGLRVGTLFECGCPGRDSWCDETGPRRSAQLSRWRQFTMGATASWVERRFTGRRRSKPALSRHRRDRIQRSIAVRRPRPAMLSFW